MKKKKGSASDIICRTCGSDNVVSRGRQIQCRVCGDYTNKSLTRKVSQFSSDGDTAEVSVMTEKRIKTLADLVEVCEIDTKIWEIERWVQGKSEGYRKDRKVEWEVIGGEVNYGKVEDSGRLLIKPLFSVKAWLKRKTVEIRNTLVVEDFIKKAKKFSPKYKKISYSKIKDKHLYELGIPDLQLGRLVMAEEAGYDIDPKRQIDIADKAIDHLINAAGSFQIDRVLFPIGNDFFNSNTAAMTTVKGTVQQDDVLWQRTYDLGCSFIVRTIDKLQQIAPVDVLSIHGNHDAERVFYLGSYLHAWYHNCPNVRVDNQPRKRKYYSYEKNLIGLTHGYFEKNGKLDSLMSYEVPDLWAQSTHREWHLGHKHHKVDMKINTEEFDNGVVVRILRSLASPSVWEFDKGLIGSQKAGEVFIWHPKDGVVAQFTSS